MSAANDPLAGLPRDLTTNGLHVAEQTKVVRNVPIVMSKKCVRTVDAPRLPGAISMTGVAQYVQVVSCRVARRQ